MGDGQGDVYEQQMADAQLCPRCSGPLKRSATPTYDGRTWVCELCRQGHNPDELRQRANCTTGSLATDALTKKGSKLSIDETALERARKRANLRRGAEGHEAVAEHIRQENRERAATARTEDTDPQIVYPSGATRSAEVEGIRYDLIPFVALRRLAARYGLGATRHGDRNWEGGAPASDTANHALEHLFKWLSGDRSEDHLAAFTWGGFALMFYEENVPEMIDTPKPEDDE